MLTSTLHNLNYYYCKAIQKNNKICGRLNCKIHNKLKMNIKQQIFFHIIEEELQRIKIKENETYKKQRKIQERFRMIEKEEQAIRSLFKLYHHNTRYI